jgi:uncharacterized protein YegP (UPF0339 family)
MKHPKFQIYRGRRRQFYFRLKARNGEIILTSEGYSSLQKCRSGIRSVRTHGSKTVRYRKETSSNRQYYFVLVAPNHEIIGTSETYTTGRWRDRGIEAVARIARDAPVENLL